MNTAALWTHNPTNRPFLSACSAQQGNCEEYDTTCECWAEYVDCLAGLECPYQLVIEAIDACENNGCPAGQCNPFDRPSESASITLAPSPSSSPSPGSDGNPGCPSSGGPGEVSAAMCFHDHRQANKRTQRVVVASLPVQAERTRVHGHVVLLRVFGGVRQLLA
jgi:hypothetical protein